MAVVMDRAECSCGCYVNIRDVLAQSVKEAQKATGTFRLLTFALGGIALLVGGIGIMNIMLVSVTERTREIGLRKAIGATRFDILSQFLIESAVVSIFGGLCGILLGGVPGVAPAHISTGMIYRGVIPFVLLQAAGIATLFVWPELATWLPRLLYH